MGFHKREAPSSIAATLWLTTLKKWLKGWGLKSCRAQAHTFMSISGPIEELQKQFPTAGAAGMRDHLRQKYGMQAPRKLILDYNKIVDPAGVAAWRAVSWLGDLICQKHTQSMRREGTT
ncbi:hypothetical protein BDM02DRAFT_3124762 [Thelephora ganbajun]|uniref:Uncharacterized protein n=1 Tax=Thelephora ganbajun TaxID=370292 RepID=A0ACB6YXN7_THEGA|nr:hypothetical protein BDM02DRAFT_3124762 [Thelephora ganbajun]